MFKLILFVFVCFAAFIVGGIFVTYLLAGVFNLLGIIFLIETIPFLKKIAKKYANLFDVLLFAFGIYASVAMSVTIGVSFVIAGLGYTMVYKPYLKGEIGTTGTTDRRGATGHQKYRHL